MREVAGSNPVIPTRKPPKVAFFIILSDENQRGMREGSKSRRNDEDSRRAVWHACAYE